MTLERLGEKEYTLQLWEDGDYVICIDGKPTGSLVRKLEGERIVAFAKQETAELIAYVRMLGEQLPIISDDLTLAYQAGAMSRDAEVKKIKTERDVMRECVEKCHKFFLTGVDDRGRDEIYDEAEWAVTCIVSNIEEV